ncbi:MAG: hypothetical protein JXA10_06600 [Anaerolineae bacterium]|nr:hypothetical protein [Anaerolineae bacterium]
MAKAKKARIMRLANRPILTFRVYEGKDGMGDPAKDDDYELIEAMVLRATGDTEQSVLSVLMQKAARYGYDVVQKFSGFEEMVGVRDAEE